MKRSPLRHQANVLLNNLNRSNQEYQKHLATSRNLVKQILEDLIQNHLSLRQLAKKLGKSPTYISHLRQGKNIATCDNYNDLMVAYNSILDAQGDSLLHKKTRRKQNDADRRTTKKNGKVHRRSHLRSATVAGKRRSMW